MVSRRKLLAAGAAVGAAAGGGLVVTGQPSHADPLIDDVFTDLRDRACDIITGKSAIEGRSPLPTPIADARAALDNRIASSISHIDRSPSRRRVFDNIEIHPSTQNSAGISRTYQYLRDLAVGWYTPGSAYHQDTAVRDDVLAGLKTVYAVVYHPGQTRYGNWFDWEIGAPFQLTDILLLLDTQIAAADRIKYSDAITYFKPDPRRHGDGQTSTGANRSAMSSIAILQGIALRSSSQISEGVAALRESAAWVSTDTGEGLYGDGSFLQHLNAEKTAVVPYTGGYGRGYLRDVAKMVPLLAGGQWDITASMSNVYTAVESGYAPVIHDGRAMSFVNGRFVANGTAEQDAGRAIIAAILQLAQAGVTDAATIQRWRGRCRGWLERAQGAENDAAGTRYSPYRSMDVTYATLIYDLFTGGVAALPEPDSSVIFRNMARAVHRRAGWAFAISMSSNRIRRYEGGRSGTSTGENLHGYHTGAGKTYLYHRSDRDQYNGSYWPTIHRQRMAGITVDRTEIPANGGQTQSPYRWAGGAVLDGMYSAVGMTYQAATTDLFARKSWFCFDEVIFCLGSSIKGGGGKLVETIVENRKLKAGTERLLVGDVAGGRTWSAADETITNPVWTHLDGVGGYIFPPSANQSVRIQRITYSGSWHDINTGGSSTVINQRYLGMAIQHGTSPAGVKYSYLVAPNATAERTEYLATVNRGIEFLAHHDRAHGVHQPATGLTMINFWDGHTAPLTAGGVTVEGDCAVVLQELNGVLKVAVARPLRDGATVRITIVPRDGRYPTLVRRDTAVTVRSNTTAGIVLDVATGPWGASFSASFTR